MGWIDMGPDCALFSGDCLDGMADLPNNSVDIVLTDPPYGLKFMHKDWDYGMPGEHFWCEILRVAKPGAILLAFGGTRTYHRLTCAIEDAGWEIRDCLMWLHGMGFPKSFDISKGMDKAAGAEREIVGEEKQSFRAVDAELLRRVYGAYKGIYSEDGYRLKSITKPSTSDAQLWDGYGTALKPAWEPIILAMKPLDGTFVHNAIKWGVGGLDIDGSRIGIAADERDHVDNRSGASTSGKWKSALAGRFPANLVLDEEAAALLDKQSGNGVSTIRMSEDKDSSKTTWALGRTGITACGHNDSGGASRFFYTSKASRSERNQGCDDFYWQRDKVAACGYVRSSRERWETLPEQERAVGNIHTTVKPLSLMEYLCKLVRTPFGGIVLDPFAGSCSTGIAALKSSMQFIGMDINQDYIDISYARLQHAWSVIT